MAKWNNIISLVATTISNTGSFTLSGDQAITGSLEVSGSTSLTGSLYITGNISASGDLTTNTVNGTINGGSF